MCCCLYWSLLAPVPVKPLATQIPVMIVMVTQCTHSCSPAAWRFRSSPVCSSRRRCPRCDTGSADIRPFGRRRTPGPTCRCCCCTDRADTLRPPPRGFHSNQVSTHHSEHLQREQECNNLFSTGLDPWQWILALKTKPELKKETLALKHD